ncbi:MAG TPA: hypothetical protein PK879_13290, partial [Opitutaceae bacterium]|nr:hypothetical protein [Opitutaceae bacterium]
MTNPFRALHPRCFAAAVACLCMALIVAFGATVARAAPPLPEPPEGVSVIAHARDIWAIGANQRNLP